MLDIKSLVNEPGPVKQSLKKRNMVALESVVDELVALDSARKKAIQEVEALKAKRNLASQEVAKLKKSGGDDSAILAEMKETAQSIKALDEKTAEVESQIKEKLYHLPNILQDEVPAGKSSEENKEIRKWGEKRTVTFPIKPHDEIGESKGYLDFKKAGEVTGARFVFLKGKVAKLERVLVQFMLDCHSARGYEEILPPFMINRDALFGTGQLPKFEEDVFRVEKFGFYLTPTAEVPVTNYHRNEILEEKRLPIKYTAYTPCFRSEAGSYGKDTKGLKRQHQFNKVELVKFTTPEKGLEELESLVADAELILQKLNLPYRTMLLCGGDTGFGSSKTYDIEVWSPAIQQYMEISSCSLFTQYQARRANIRYRDSTGKVHFVNTLNGSGLAIGRTVLAIMENYQTADGDFEIPEALKKYW